MHRIMKKPKRRQTDRFRQGNVEHHSGFEIGTQMKRQHIHIATGIEIHASREKQGIVVHLCGRSQRPAGSSTANHESRLATDELSLAPPPSTKVKSVNQGLEESDTTPLVAAFRQSRVSPLELRYSIRPTLPAPPCILGSPEPRPASSTTCNTRAGKSPLLLSASAPGPGPFAASCITACAAPEPSAPPAP